jgi:uncharacterized membrane protein
MVFNYAMRDFELSNSIEAERQKIKEKIDELEERIERSDSHGFTAYSLAQKLAELRQRLERIQALLSQ